MQTEEYHTQILSNFVFHKHSEKLDFSYTLFSHTLITRICILLQYKYKPIYRLNNQKKQTEINSHLFEQKHKMITQVQKVIRLIFEQYSTF